MAFGADTFLFIHIIGPSILSADFARLGEEVSRVIEAGADFVHFDVMDNHYVPNLSFGALVCRALRNYPITAPIDVHLMARPVDRLIVEFAEAGATYISFHPEASDHVDRSLQLIRDSGRKSGLVFNPATPLDWLNYVLDKIDMILLMSVNPGFSGQTFILAVFKKIEQVRDIIRCERPHDPARGRWGVNLSNIQIIARAGADTFVDCNTIDFKGRLEGWEPRLHRDCWQGHRWAYLLQCPPVVLCAHRDGAEGKFDDTEVYRRAASPGMKLPYGWST